MKRKTAIRNWLARARSNPFRLRLAGGGFIFLLMAAMGLSAFTKFSNQEATRAAPWDDVVLLSDRDGADLTAIRSSEPSFGDLPAALVDHIYPHSEDEFWVFLNNTALLASVDGEVRFVDIAARRTDVINRQNDHISSIHQTPFIWSSSDDIERVSAPELEHDVQAPEGRSMISFVTDPDQRIRAVTSMDNGDLVAAHFADDRIRRYAPRGDSESDETSNTPSWQQVFEEEGVLLGRPGDADSDAISDRPYGDIVSLFALPDDQIVFAAVSQEPLAPGIVDGPAPYNTQLWLFDGESVSNITPEDVDGIHGPYYESAVVYDSSNATEQLPIHMLSQGPDDTILMVSFGGQARWHTRSSAPGIWHVDPVTGTSEILVYLDGVFASAHYPISAAAVGDDLVFQAEGKLWLLEDAFA